MLLHENNIDIPEEWKYDENIDEYYKQYDIDYNDLINPEYNDNKDKMTYAMFLANKGIIPSKEW